MEKISLRVATDPVELAKIILKNWSLLSRTVYGNGPKTSTMT